MFVAGQIPTADALNELGLTVDTYTPTLEATTTDPDLGTSPTQEGVYVLQGRLVIAWARIEFGSSASAGSGSYRLSLPTEAAGLENTGSIAGGDIVGTGACRDSSSFPNGRTFVCQLVGNTVSPAGTGTVMMITDGDGASGASAHGYGQISDDAPFIWSDGDRITAAFMYLRPA